MTGHHDYENGYKRGYVDGKAANAAPALLEALEEIACCDIDVDTGERVDPAISVANVLETARAAIAQAKGE